MFTNSDVAKSEISLFRYSLNTKKKVIPAENCAHVIILKRRYVMVIGESSMRHAQMSLCLELVFIVAVSKVKSDTLVLAYLRILSDIKKMLKVYYLPFCIKRGLGRVIFTSRGTRQRY